MQGQITIQTKQPIEDDYDLRQRFIDAGIEPLWPTHPAWDEFNDACRVLQTGGLDFNAIDTHDLIEMCRNERADIKKNYGYGLASTPIIETYIRWCTQNKEELNNSVCDADNTVNAHPIIITALRNYVLALDNHQIHEAHQAVELISKTAPLELDVQQKLTNNMNQSLQLGATLPMVDIVKLAPYLSTPLSIPMDQTEKFVMLTDYEWPYEPSDNQTITAKSQWFIGVARMEPLIASWFESEEPEATLIGAVYNYLPMVNFNKKDLYTTWLYIALDEFIHKESVMKSPQYEDLQTFILDSTKVIPTEQQDLWRKQLNYLNGLYDNALAKAIVLNAYNPNVIQYPVDMMEPS